MCVTVHWYHLIFNNGCVLPPVCRIPANLIGSHKSVWTGSRFLCLILPELRRCLQRGGPAAPGAHSGKQSEVGGRLWDGEDSGSPRTTVFLLLVSYHFFMVYPQVYGKRLPIVYGNQPKALFLFYDLLFPFQTSTWYPCLKWAQSLNTTRSVVLFPNIMSLKRGRESRDPSVTPQVSALGVKSPTMISLML